MEDPTLAPRRETVGNKAEAFRSRVACEAGSLACATCVNVVGCPFVRGKIDQAPARNESDNADMDIPSLDAGPSDGDSNPFRSYRDELFSDAEEVFARPRELSSNSVKSDEEKTAEREKPDKKKVEPPVKDAEKPKLKRDPESRQETAKREATKPQPSTKPDTDNKLPTGPKPTEKPKPIKATRSAKEPGKSKKRPEPSEQPQPTEGAITQFVKALTMEAPSKQPPEPDTPSTPTLPKDFEQPAPQSREAAERPALQPVPAVSPNEKSQKASPEPQPAAKPSSKPAAQEAASRETYVSKTTEASKKPEPIPATHVETKPRQEESANKPSATKQPVLTVERPPQQGTNPSGKKLEQQPAKKAAVAVVPAPTGEQAQAHPTDKPTTTVPSAESQPISAPPDKHSQPKDFVLPQIYQPPIAESPTQVLADTIDKSQQITDLPPATSAITDVTDTEYETPAATESRIATELVVSADTLDERPPSPVDNAISPEVDEGTAPIEATDGGEVVETTRTEPEPQSQVEPSQSAETDVVPVTEELTKPEQDVTIPYVDSPEPDISTQLSGVSAPNTPEASTIISDRIEGEPTDLQAADYEYPEDIADQGLDPEMTNYLSSDINKDEKDSPLQHDLDDEPDIEGEPVNTVEDVGYPEQPDPPSDALESIEKIINRILGRIAYELVA